MTKVRLHPDPREGGPLVSLPDVDGVIVEFTSYGGGMVPVGHGLGRIPVGAIELSHSGECYWSPRGVKGTYACSPWTISMAYFRPTTDAGTVHRFLIF